MPPLPVAIVGAGIGGLTAGLALAQAGHPVTLIEQRTGFGEAGAGLQLSPNASRVLAGLGLGAALRRIAAEPPGVLIRSLASGMTIGGVAMGPRMRERFGAPYLVVHRRDLHTVLLDAVRGGPDIRLLLGRTVRSAAQGADEVSLDIEKAGGGHEVLKSSIVVGADGLWSTMGPAIGDGRAPAYRGIVAWRATLPRAAAPAELGGDETGLWLGPGGHVVHYPVAGGRLLNVVAFQRRDEPVEGWSTLGDPAVLRTVFRKAAEPLQQLLACEAEWRLWSLFDLPARAMARGRIALLGDAAHPVLPFLAQGAALAIEDAAILAACLGEPGSDPRRALARYARVRRSRVRRVQAAARKNAFVYHAGPLAALARNLVMRRLGPDGMTERYAWIYGWTPPASAAPSPGGVGTLA